jgi:hypothetical protein
MRWAKGRDIALRCAFPLFAKAYLCAALVDGITRPQARQGMDGAAAVPTKPASLHRASINFGFWWGIKFIFFQLKFFLNISLA